MRQDQNDKAHGFMVQGKGQDDKKQNLHKLCKSQDDKNRIYTRCARGRIEKKG